MKMKALALAVTLAAFGVSANQSPTEPEMTPTQEQQAYGEQSAASVKKAKRPSKQVRDDIRAYLKEVRAAVAHRDVKPKFVSGTASVTLTKDHPMWAIARSNAVRAAIADAKQNHLKGLNKSIKTEAINSLFDDSGSPRPSPEDFKTDRGMAGILDKAIALMEAKLDSELVEAGIDPKMFANASPSQKRVLMSKSFAEKTITNAFGDMSGMFVIKAFETFDDSGKGTVGVVMAQSAKKREKIKALVSSQGQVQPDPSMAIPEHSNLATAFADAEVPYLSMGTSLSYDDKGFPIIVSYGQAGVEYTDNDDILDIKIEAAQAAAESNAMANLAQAYNMSGNFAREVTASSNKLHEVTDALTSSTSVTTTDPGMVEQVRQVVDQSSKMTAEVSNLNGVEVVNNWEMEHPITGHTMVGVTMVWHPLADRESRQMQSGKSHSQMEAEAKAKKGGTQLHSRSSKSRFDPDF